MSEKRSELVKEGELDRQATVAKNATVQKEARRSVLRDIEYYNLDAVISVGRVFQAKAQS